MITGNQSVKLESSKDESPVSTRQKPTANHKSFIEIAKQMLTKLHAAISAFAPVGYEDSGGFHYGVDPYSDHSLHQ